MLASSPLTWTPVEDGLENRTGIVTKPLMDLQRLIVCAVAASPLEPSNEDKKSIREVVGASSISARVNMILKSNTAVRTGQFFFI